MSGSNRKQRVAYFYDPDVGNFYYGEGHPMKPHRVRMAHDLILRYKLYEHMEVFKPLAASKEEMVQFHSDEYVDFLSTVLPGSQDKILSEYNLANDCPVFDGLYKYCQVYSGGSIGGAVKLNYSASDIVINWAGGLHHAKKSEASGFCYINDIVLAILELLKHHQRVLYLDIDVHHGDGVEEAFLTTNRVMTVSFHKYGNEYFPGTGNIDNVGLEAGQYYAVNVPLADGMDDTAYRELFEPIMSKVMEVYRPEAVVLQSGADSLSGDRLGVFNLSIKGHAACHEFMKKFNVPMLVLGGGGYKIKNVARCWAYETGVLLGVGDEMQDQLPANEYYDYYKPDYLLHVPLDPRNAENKNKREVLEKLRNEVLRNLGNVEPVGVPFHEVPPDAVPLESMVGVRMANGLAA